MSQEHSGKMNYTTGRARPSALLAPGAPLHRATQFPACTASTSKPTPPSAHLAPASPPPGSPPGHPPARSPPPSPLELSGCGREPQGGSCLSVWVCLSGSEGLSVQQAWGRVEGTPVSLGVFTLLLWLGRFCSICPRLLCKYEFALHGWAGTSIHVHGDHVGRGGGPLHVLAAAPQHLPPHWVSPPPSGTWLSP